MYHSVTSRPGSIRRYQERWLWLLRRDGDRCKSERPRNEGLVMPDENEVEATTDNDTLTGGAGADTFVFGRDHGDDVITDFTSGEDRIDLSAFAVRSLSDLTITTDESGLTIDLTAHGGGTIRLDGVGLDDLEDSDFVTIQPS